MHKKEIASAPEIIQEAKIDRLSARILEINAQAAELEQEAASRHKQLTAQYPDKVGFANMDVPTEVAMDPDHEFFFAKLPGVRPDDPQAIVIRALEKKAKDLREIALELEQALDLRVEADKLDKEITAKQAQIEAQYPSQVSYPNVSVSIETEMDPDFVFPPPITVPGIRPDHPKMIELYKLKEKAEYLRSVAIDLELAADELEKAIN